MLQAVAKHTTLEGESKKINLTFAGILRSGGREEGLNRWSLEAPRAAIYGQPCVFVLRK
jgi:hypothetical protein